MAKVKIEAAQRAATLAIKVACSISDEKLYSVVRGIFGELERLLLPPGQRLLTSAAEASLELHMRALELGAERTFIAAGEAVCVDVEKALRKLITSPAYRLATPSFDGSHVFLWLSEYTYPHSARVSVPAPAPHPHRTCTASAPHLHRTRTRTAHRLQRLFTYSTY